MLHWEGHPYKARKEQEEYKVQKRVAECSEPKQGIETRSTQPFNAKRKHLLEIAIDNGHAAVVYVGTKKITKDLINRFA